MEELKRLQQILCEQEQQIKASLERQEKNDYLLGQRVLILGVLIKIKGRIQELEKNTYVDSKKC